MSLTVFRDKALRLGEDFSWEEYIFLFLGVFLGFRGIVGGNGLLTEVFFFLLARQFLFPRRTRSKVFSGAISLVKRDKSDEESDEKI